MKKTHLTIILVSIMAALAACSKGAPDIENLEELTKISQGGSGKFIFKVEGKTYTYSHYKNNFCTNKVDDKNCVKAHDLFYAYKSLPSKSAFGNTK